MTIQEKITAYKMSAETLALIKSTKLLLISSITGGGKDTVVREVLKDEGFYRIITHTTRQPRSNHGVKEVDGVDYHFVTLEQAEKLIDEKAFVETKYVHGNIYGTTAAEFEVARSRKLNAVTDIDVQGVTEYLDVKPDTHAVFLLPPSVNTWLQRLEKRYGDLDRHAEEVSKRFRSAYEEIRHIQADERFVLIINDDLATTVARVNGVLDGTVVRTSGYADKVTEHLLDFLQAKIDEQKT
jgi:guanylate kinase